MNIPLLRAIQKQILKEPKQFCMHSFFTRAGYGKYKIPNCGTAACIAGWAMAISHRETPQECSQNLTYIPEATSLLEISYEESLRLFYQTNWPKDLSEAYWENKYYPIIQAIYACERIDRFIASEGKE